MPNRYQTKYHKIIKVLKSSLANKRKAGWSRAVGAGFIAEEIGDMYITKGKSVTTLHMVTHDSTSKLSLKVPALNLRETEEALKAAEHLANMPVCRTCGDVWYPNHRCQ